MSPMREIKSPVHRIGNAMSSIAAVWLTYPEAQMITAIPNRMRAIGLLLFIEPPCLFVNICFIKSIFSLSLL